MNAQATFGSYAVSDIEDAESRTVSSKGLREQTGALQSQHVAREQESYRLVEVKDCEAQPARERGAGRRCLTAYS